MTSQNVVLMLNSTTNPKTWGLFLTARSRAAAASLSNAHRRNPFYCPMSTQRGTESADSHRICPMDSYRIGLIVRCHLDLTVTSDDTMSLSYAVNFVQELFSKTETPQNTSDATPFV